MEDLEAGPFRTAEPTSEARLVKEREASWERVRAQTERAIDAERRRERARDRLAWGGLLLSGVGTAAVFALTSVRGDVGAPLVCPAIAAVVSALLVVGFRRRLSVRSREPR